ncbi:hypothetical protein MUG78_17420 [Gordonia alkaliphila]|uniref:hypothetical protein n=1 Tax=Gordonia alkaliphila TaxID=1053547 RepID=UPI001FF69840|nr:hypothetical protein [Gordonia alkaliphila]MCK0441182.1 hypothetical protein [Gordonia alkaliphila]
MYSEIIDLSAGSTAVPWKAITLIGVVFLVVLAGLARMGYLATRRVAVLAAFGAIYLLASIFGQTSHHGYLADKRTSAANTQLAQAWPDIARVNGGLLHSPPEPGQYTVHRGAALCKLTLTESGHDLMAAAMTCSGQPVEPVAS